jgi:hypothetical protein
MLLLRGATPARKSRLSSGLLEAMSRQWRPLLAGMSDQLLLASTQLSHHIETQDPRPRNVAKRRTFSSLEAARRNKPKIEVCFSRVMNAECFLPAWLAPFLLCHPWRLVYRTPRHLQAGTTTTTKVCRRGGRLWCPRRSRDELDGGAVSSCPEHARCMCRRPHCSRILAWVVADLGVRWTAHVCVPGGARSHVCRPYELVRARM